MGYTRKQFRDELNTIFGDSLDATWPKEQKDGVINQGIDALWPECKSTKVDETVTLAADTFIYTPTGQPPEMGYQQAFLEQGTGEPYKLMGRIQQRRELVTSTLKWKIYVPEDIVDANEGKKIRLHYHDKFDHYSDDTTSQDVPWLPVLYHACMMLCVYMLQKGGHSDISVWKDQIPEWRGLWLQSKKDNLVLSMAQYIRFRRQ